MPVQESSVSPMTIAIGCATTASIAAMAFYFLKKPKVEVTKELLLAAMKDVEASLSETQTALKEFINTTLPELKKSNIPVDKITQVVFMEFEKRQKDAEDVVFNAKGFTADEAQAAVTGEFKADKDVMTQVVKLKTLVQGTAAEIQMLIRSIPGFSVDQFLQYTRESTMLRIELTITCFNEQKATGMKQGTPEWSKVLYDAIRKRSTANVAKMHAKYGITPQTLQQAKMIYGRSPKYVALIQELNALSNQRYAAAGVKSKPAARK